MTDLTVQIPAKVSSYTLCLRPDFEDLTEQIALSGLKPDRIAVIADTNTAPLYAGVVSGYLESLADHVTLVTLPAGETAKTIETVQQIYSALINAQLTRKSLLVSLGGGVICDLTGFAAATYMRGIPFVQIPTTLLSQVDASIGGKTGFDYLGYKNMIGAFHMPALVYINPAVLATLPQREFCSGMAEIIKAGLIYDRDFYNWLNDKRDAIISLNEAVCLDMIRRADEIKQAVVEADPYESGLRMILNFGHTIGHAIEKAKNFTLTHGECVALGMAAAARISAARKLIPSEDALAAAGCCRSFGLPLTVDGLKAADVIANTHADKKAQSGAVRFVLLEKIGRAVVTGDVSDREMEEALSDILV